MIYAQVLANNYATTMDINAPLLPHMATTARLPGREQREALYNLGGTRLVGQAQADMFFVLDDGTVLQSAREGDAAITGGFVGRARARGYDEEDDVEAIKAMLVNPANSRRRARGAVHRRSDAGPRGATGSGAPTASLRARATTPRPTRGRATRRWRTRTRIAPSSR